jgi:hypothetical protein
MSSRTTTTPYGFLCAALTVVLCSQDVEAQSAFCTPIRQGDTASKVAARVSGDSRNRYRSWFQIVDPTTGRAIPKSEYDRIRAGWTVCIVQSPLGRTAPRRESAIAAALAPLEVVAAVWHSNPPILLLCGLAGLASAYGWTTLDEYVRQRRRMLAAMTHFAALFVREFERPLTPVAGETRAIRSRVITSADRGRFEILLAPAGARRYPNLADHRHNVLYDVRRVGHALRDQPFVAAPPYERDGWVVIPFHRGSGPIQEGVS